MSASGSSDSRCSSWATTRLATSSSIGLAEEDDALVQQPRVDVEGPLAAGVLLDDHGDQGHWATPFRNHLVARFVVRLSCNPMVARDITLPVDPDEAWEALTDPELLEQWFGDGDREAVIEEAEPGERLVFWWWEEGEPRIAGRAAPRRRCRRARASACARRPSGPFALA